MANDTMKILIGIAVIWFVMGQGTLGGSTAQTGAPVPDGTCPDSAATVAFGAVSTYDQSTDASETDTVKVNGGVPQTATTSYPVGANLEILWTVANYIGKTTTYTVPCGGGVISTTMDATGTASFRIFNSDGNPVSNDATGDTTNQTALGSGGSRNIQIWIDGLSKQSTGDLLIVVEHTNTSGCGDFTLSGLGGASTANLPGFYAANNANSKSFAYNVPALRGATAGSVSGTLHLEAKAGKVCDGAVYVTAYSKQAFQDTDGTFVVGVEDADDTVKYEDTWDYDFYIDRS